MGHITVSQRPIYRSEPSLVQNVKSAKCVPRRASFSNGQSKPIRTWMLNLISHLRFWDDLMRRLSWAFLTSA